MNVDAPTLFDSTESSQATTASELPPPEANSSNEGATTLEGILQGEEGNVRDLLRSCAKLTAALKQWGNAAKLGLISERDKQSMQSRELTRQLLGRIDDVCAGWTFDTRGYLETNQWIHEVTKLAADDGFVVREEADLLLSSPVAISSQPSRNTLRIGKTTWKAIRPSIVLGELRRLRESTDTKGAQTFLNSLYMASQHLKTTTASFKEIYEIFCLTPGYRKEMPKPAFGQEIYALHRSEVKTTSKGIPYQFQLAAGNVKESDVFTVISEDGRAIRYYGIRFLDE